MTPTTFGWIVSAVALMMGLVSMLPGICGRPLGLILSGFGTGAASVNVVYLCLVS